MDTRLCEVADWDIPTRRLLDAEYLRSNLLYRYQAESGTLQELSPPTNTKPEMTSASRGRQQSLNPPPPPPPNTVTPGVYSTERQSSFPTRVQSARVSPPRTISRQHLYDDDITGRRKGSTTRLPPYSNSNPISDGSAAALLPLRGASSPSSSSSVVVVTPHKEEVGDDRNDVKEGGWEHDYYSSQGTSPASPSPPLSRAEQEPMVGSRPALGGLVGLPPPPPPTSGIPPTARSGSRSSSSVAGRPPAKRPPSTTTTLSSTEAMTILKPATTAATPTATESSPNDKPVGVVVSSPISQQDEQPSRRKKTMVGTTPVTGHPPPQVQQQEEEGAPDLVVEVSLDGVDSGHNIEVRRGDSPSQLAARYCALHQLGLNDQGKLEQALISAIHSL